MGDLMVLRVAVEVRCSICGGEWDGKAERGEVGCRLRTASESAGSPRSEQFTRLSRRAAPLLNLSWWLLGELDCGLNGFVRSSQLEGSERVELFGWGGCRGLWGGGSHLGQIGYLNLGSGEIRQ